jgi:hypothetical protein
MNPIWIILAIVLVFVTIALLNRVLQWMEDKGWIYYRKNQPRGTTQALLGGVEEFLHPEIRHVQEDKSQRAEEKRDADPSNK